MYGPIDDYATPARTDDVSDFSSTLANTNSSSTGSYSAHDSNATSQLSERVMHVSPKTSAIRKPSALATALETPHRKVKGKRSVQLLMELHLTATECHLP